MVLFPKKCVEFPIIKVLDIQVIFLGLQVIFRSKPYYEKRKIGHPRKSGLKLL